MSPTTVRVQLAGTPAGGYEVDIGTTLDAVGVACARLESVTRWAVIADASVAECHGSNLRRGLTAAGIDPLWLEVEPGEHSKSRAQVARLQDALLEARVGRDGAVLAFGGGVIGDLAGFVAATVYRGIVCVQVPTSLLAMVDSSVGGKTGIDTPAGKNLVGAFHQPARVLIDIGALDTLPDAELRSGLAEVIKYGVIGEEELFVDLEDGLLESCLARVPAALESVIRRCVQAKAAVVAEDEREANRRQVLNFGHTVAHAVEAGLEYGVRHGEAVAIGMVVEARVAEKRAGAEPGMSARIADLCARAGLPTAVPEGCSAAGLLEAARGDKKARGDVLRCALPLSLGVMARDDDGNWSVPVSDAELTAALQGA